MTRNLRGSLLIASMLVVLVDDVLRGVPPASGLSAQPVLLPNGVHLREPDGLLQC